MQGISEREIQQAVTEAARVVAEYGTGSSVAEIGDMAWDVLSETGDGWAYLEPAQDWEIMGRITREVLHRAGLSSGASDASEVPQATLEVMGR